MANELANTGYIAYSYEIVVVNYNSLGHADIRKQYE